MASCGKAIISYKVLTEIELFKPLAKGGGNIIGLAQLQ